MVKQLMLTVAGVIGAGKSTFTKELAGELGTKPFYEPVGGNPVLPLYYSDPEKYGFLLQIYFLNKRFKMIKAAYKENNNILDRSIYEDLLFTTINHENGNFTDEEFDTYKSLLDNMMEEIEGLPKKAPDLMIYLDVDFDTMLSRIKLRGREFEQFDENKELKNYYHQVWEEYQKWYDDYDLSAKIKIDVAKHDLVTEEGKDFAISVVKNKLKEEGLI